MPKVTIATNKLLKLKGRIRCVCGGTSASKTYSILMILIDWCQVRKNKKVDVMSESYPHLEDGVIKDFKEIMLRRDYWKDKNWNETKHVYTFETGTILKFISIDKLGKAHGPRRDVLFMNEANNIDYKIYEQLEVRTKEIIWLDWNPTHEFWYYTELKDRVKHDFITLTYKDCIDALPPAIVESIESRKWNKNWWLVYGLGQLGEVESRIYTKWKFIDSIPHEARLERYGLDFGYTNDPSAVVAIYYYNGSWILDEKLYRKGMSNKAIADVLKVLPEKLTVADSAEPKSIDEISSYGLNLQACKKGRDSVRSGIQLIQDQPISVTKRSINLIKEYRNYMWKYDANGLLISPNMPEKGGDHLLDALRYGMEGLGRLKQEVDYWDRIWEKELSPIQKLKNKFNRGR